jgi:hypothetical protein
LVDFSAFLCYTAGMSDVRSLPPTKAMIGKWSVDRYVSLIRRWSFIAALIILVLVLSQQTRWLVVAAEIFFICLIGWFVRRREGGKIEGLAAGAFIGVTLGLVASIGRYAVNPTLANGILILIETILTTALSAVLATTTILLLNLIHQPKN